jgi:hypothetical protein
MLYRFKSKTTSDLIMLEPTARRILEIIGKTPDAKGIILVAQMPEAIDRIEKAIAKEKAGRLVAMPNNDGNEKEAPLGLSQRARPFVDVLGRCHHAGCDLVWGV